MDDDEMISEEFRAALAKSIPARRVPGPRPRVIDRLPDRPTIHITAATYRVSVESELTAAPIERSPAYVDVRRHAMIPAWM